MNNDYELIEQQTVITADINQSFVVNAPPGTGKTYTIIEKIKYLVQEEKIPGEKIFVLSHTNAAVNEIKKRLIITSQQNNLDSSIYNVNVRTISSFVKYCLYKIDCIRNNEKETKTFYTYKATEDGFTKANQELLNRIRHDINSLLDNLEIQYFIVDEIQDAVDEIARIVLRFVRACVERNISFSLFGDECQAIFDFDKDKKEHYSSLNFYKKIKKDYLKQKNIQFVSFSQNWRQQADMQKFQKLFDKYRIAIMDNDKNECNNKFEEIKNSTTNKYPENYIDNPKHCILVHSNDRALYIASKCRKKGIPVTAKIRDNKVIFEYHEWIAKVLPNATDADGYITFDTFKSTVEKYNVQLPTNYSGYKEKELIKSFYSYLNKILKQDSDYDIEQQNLIKKIMTEQYNSKGEMCQSVSEMRN